MTAVARGKTGAAVAIVFTSIATLTVVARLFTRYILVRNPGWEELAILSAWLFSTVHTILCCVQVSLGLGDRGVNIPDAVKPQIFLSFWVIVPLYSIALYLIKVSILLLYLRIFPDKKLTRACRAVIIIMSVFLLWTVFSFMFRCTPVAYSWDKSLNGRCLDPKPLYFTNASFNIVTDFVLFGLPLPVLWGLQLPPRKRLGLIILFAIALLGCLTSILRLRSLYYFSISTDVIYDNLSIGVWSCVEVSVGIVCACIPTLKPLVKALFPQLVSGTTRPSRQSRMYPTSPQDSRTVLSQQSQSQSHITTTYVQFDKGCDIQAEEGQVKVTKSYALS